MRRFELPKNSDGLEVMVEATDEPDVDGVNHSYQIYQKANGSWETAAKIRFRKGPSAFGDGSYAVTDEALLAVVLDHLQGLIRGKQYTPQRANATIMLEKAVGALRGERDSKVNATPKQQGKEEESILELPEIKPKKTKPPKNKRGKS